MPSLLLRLTTFRSRLHRPAHRRRFLTMLILISILSTILFTLYSIYKPPSLLISYLAHRSPSTLWRISTPRKIVALTIDDAPSDHTPALLDILAAHGARATFFVIGNQVPGREAILRRIVQAGHELGNHALRDEPSALLPDPLLQSQLLHVQALIRAAHPPGAPEPPRYFRPGSGFFNQRLLALAESLGFRVVLGSVYPHDAQIAWPRVNAAHILSMVRPGAVVVCHDRRSWTADMLKRVVPELGRRGYTIGTVGELLQEADRERERQLERGG